MSKNKLIIIFLMLFSQLATAVDFTVELTPAANSVGDTQVSSISNTKINGLGTLSTKSSLLASDIPSLLSSKISDFASSVISSMSSTLSNYLLKSDLDNKRVEVKYGIPANVRTITNAGGVLTFPTMILDNLSAYNSSTGKFIAPQSGLYLVAANLFTSATLNSSTSWFFSAVKLNTSGASIEVIALDNKAGTGAPNTNNAVKLTGIVRLAVGEGIQIESSLDTLTTLPITQSYNQLSIVKISD